jgi:hypothetical protein
MASPAPPDSPASVTLVLYTRRGCCLCEGLEERLRALEPLSGASLPPLQPVDVDADPQLQARYGMEVPVLALRDAVGSLRELPRVPPRLTGERLVAWLLKQGVATASAPPGADQA